MGPFQLLLASCGILGTTFPNGTSTEFKLLYSESNPIEIMCKNDPTDKSTLVCAFSENDPTQQNQKKTRIARFTFAIVGSGELVLSDASGRENFQIRKGLTVYHQRVLSDSASLEKVCLGTIKPQNTKP